MSGPTSTEPPRWEHAPGGGMPDNCIGGAVQGGGGAGGTADLLDSAGKPAGNVMENRVVLIRVSQDRQTYQFSGVPEGSYSVRVTLNTGAIQTKGPVGPGSEVALFEF
jgi:hypothetical protein